MSQTPSFLEFLEGNRQAIVTHIGRADIRAAVAWERNPWKKVRDALRIMKQKEDFLEKLIRETRAHKERMARGKAVDERESFTWGITSFCANSRPWAQCSKI